MVRLLDRYLLRELMMPLGACLGGFFIFWTAFNLLGDLPEFQRQHLRPLDVCAHTLAGIPEQLNTVLPVGLLLGLLYTLTQLTRHHELTAMRAAGVSLFRVVLPYLGLGLACSIGLFVLNERLWPNGSERQDRILHRHDTPAQQTERLWKKGLNYQGAAVRWNIGAIQQETGELRNPRVWQPLPSDVRWVFSTDRLRWNRSAWRPVTNLLEAIGRTAADLEPLKRFTSAGDFPVLSANPADVLQWPAETLAVDYPYTVVVTNAGVRTNVVAHTNVLWRTNLVVPPASNGVVWRIRAYDPVLQELHGVRVTVPPLPGSSRVTSADAGDWKSGRWVLRQVTDVIYRGPKDSDPLNVQLAELAMPELDQSWEMLRSEMRVGQFNQKKVLRGAKLSMAEIENYRRLHPEIPGPMRAWLDTQYYARWAAPWTCLVVVLIAIPFGVPTGRRNVFYGVAGSLALAFCFFVLQQVGFALGQAGQAPAWMAAWLPNGVFGFTGIVLLCRVR
jgi:lipopolysaccharide export LptBFGC system permease protein LptF